MKTASGYPFSKMFQGSGKYSCFTAVAKYPDGRTYYVMKDELAAKVEKIQSDLFNRGDVTDNFYVDSLKDERRKIQRVKDGNTRLFNVGNIAWLIIKKKYAWWLYQLFKDLGVDGHTAIGMNMFGPEVSTLVQNLKAKGMNFTDGDIKNWDGNMGPHDWDDCAFFMSELSFYILKTSNMSADGLFELGRKLLLLGKACKIRIHICGNMMYLVFWGMPSGDFFTALFNSISHILKDIQIFGLFWKNYDKYAKEEHHAMQTAVHTKLKYIVPPEIIEVIVKDIKKSRQILETFTYIKIGGLISANWRSLVHMWADYTYTCKMGDDNVDSVIDILRPYYTPSRKQEIWKELGYEYTDAAKTGIMKYTELDELQFLKCHFLQHTNYPDHWLMAMDMTTIQELTNWVRTGQDPMDAVIVNLSDALRFTYARGEKVFNETRDLFQEALKTKNVSIELLTYTEVDTTWQVDHGLF
jgi:hypothetical protein